MPIPHLRKPAKCRHRIQYQNLAVNGNGLYSLIRTAQGEIRRHVYKIVPTECLAIM